MVNDLFFLTSCYTAFLLPFIIAFTGFAVDVGNLYVQHQRLQNAADAAVLAGAKAYAENNEKVDSHPKADERAKEYNQQVYYRIDLSKEVPLYFLSFIKEKQSVDVTSIASIEENKQEDSPGFFNNLFIFSNSFNCTNSIEHRQKRPGSQDHTVGRELNRTSRYN